MATQPLLRLTLLGLAMALPSAASAGVSPLLSSSWGQGGAYQGATPSRDGAQTYPGCTTIAAAQVLYYYRYLATPTRDVSYVLDHDLISGDIDGRTLTLPLSTVRHQWETMADNLEGATPTQRSATAQFIYHVGASLNAQFGGGEGASATGRQIENAFRYTWGYNHKRRRDMTIISKDAFGYSNREWADLMRSELDAGRPVLYMAQQSDANVGHAFVIDGYRDDGMVHVNFGWAGYANGYYDANTLTDRSGRSWNRQPMIFLGLEPEAGYAKKMMAEQPGTEERYSWNGNGSLISKTSRDKTGYGLNTDEGLIHETSRESPVVFFQWEVDKTDGARLKIEAPGVAEANITYGLWDSRANDRTYSNVQLPFVLDPVADGHRDVDGKYFVIAVHFDTAKNASVIATATNVTRSPNLSAAGASIEVDGHEWHGNGSIIAKTSGTLEGYGLTHDITRIHPTSKKPVVFFQWEVDGSDGGTLQIDAENRPATITYGPWNDRSKDIVRQVQLPHTIDPASDGFSSNDGQYFVIKVAFHEAPTQPTNVSATSK